MKIVISKKHEPSYNLVLEETLLKDPNMSGDILLIYVNHNSIIIGRNQNVHEEIDSNFVEEKNITLFRRISGGGAVYHDKGNINFSFITNNSNGTYIKFLEPIIKFLKSLGLNAEFKGKNDLVVDGYKISGNAQYKYKDRMFHHGTLLFDADFSILGKALKPNPLKLKSKSIKSASQRVSNIKNLLDEEITAAEFQNKLVKFFMNEEASEIFNVDDYKVDEIWEEVNNKKSDEWTYGKNPEFTLSNETRFNGGTIKFNANIVKNKVKDITFTGDFLSLNDFENIYKHFLNKSYDLKSMRSSINNINDFSDYFGKITKDEILSLMFPKNI